VIVAPYTPGAKFPGMSTEMVGFQLAELMPVLVPVTTVVTPVRFDAATPVATTPADIVIVPAA
jgi:ABC-type xylose transport system permease subunit